jgi:hypothetical protein
MLANYVAGWRGSQPRIADFCDSAKSVGVECFRMLMHRHAADDGGLDHHHASISIGLNQIHILSFACVQELTNLMHDFCACRVELQKL